MKIETKSFRSAALCRVGIAAACLFILSGCQSQEQREAQQADLWKKSAQPPADYIANANAKRKAAQQPGAVAPQTTPSAP